MNLFLQIYYKFTIEINKNFGYFIKKVDSNTEQSDIETEESLNVFDGIINISQTLKSLLLTVLLKIYKIRY